MPRKFVTGDSHNIVVECHPCVVKVECQVCGAPVAISIPHVGDILCPKCSESASYSVRTRLLPEAVEQDIS